MVQVEASLDDWSLLRADGEREVTVAVAATTAKVGLTGSADLEVTWTPLVRLHVPGERARSGAGETLVRFKQRLTREGAPVQVGAIPFIKLPTAKQQIGNGMAEGGVALPLSFSVAGPLLVTLGPEADFLADADGHGRHTAIVNLINLSATVAPRLTLAIDGWRNLNFNPRGTVRQASADVAAAYLVFNRLQLDAGANLGLTKATAAVELYAGAAIRF